MTWPWQKPKVQIYEVKTIDPHTATACIAIGIILGLYLAAVIVRGQQAEG